jgi:dTDP-4-amino-4,6-dideoxygalactose transaminase
MILTNRADLAEKIKLLRFHGSGGTYYHRTIGYCSRLDGIQAAILRLKAKHLATWNDARRTNAATYEENLAHLADHITLPCPSNGNYHIYHQYTIRVHGGRREALQRHLTDSGIQSAIYYPLALHLQEAYAGLGYVQGDLPVSEEATREALSLPVHAELTAEQVQSVADAVRSFFR